MPEVAVAESEPPGRAMRELRLREAAERLRAAPRPGESVELPEAMGLSREREPEAVMVRSEPAVPVRMGEARVRLPRVVNEPEPSEVMPPGAERETVPGLPKERLPLVRRMESAEKVSWWLVVREAE